MEVTKDGEAIEIVQLAQSAILKEKIKTPVSEREYHFESHGALMKLYRVEECIAKSANNERN